MENTIIKFFDIIIDRLDVLEGASRIFKDYLIEEQCQRTGELNSAIFGVPFKLYSFPLLRTLSSKMVTLAIDIKTQSIKDIFNQAWWDAFIAHEELTLTHISEKITKLVKEDLKEYHIQKLMSMVEDGITNFDDLLSSSYGLKTHYKYVDEYFIDKLVRQELHDATVESFIQHESGRMYFLINTLEKTTIASLVHSAIDTLSRFGISSSHIECMAVFEIPSCLNENIKDFFPTDAHGIQQNLENALHHKFQLQEAKQFLEGIVNMQKLKPFPNFNELEAYLQHH